VVRELVAGLEFAAGGAVEVAEELVVAVGEPGLGELLPVHDKQLQCCFVHDVLLVP